MIVNICRYYICCSNGDISFKILLGIIVVDFDATSQLLIMYCIRQIKTKISRDRPRWPKGFRVG